MKKTTYAILAAFVMTMILALGMFAVGQDILFPQAAAAQAETTTVVVSNDTQGAQQLQQILAEYQGRESQYQQQLADAAERINTANQQLAQANLQIEQYQSALNQLQSQGVITLGTDGSITVNQQAAMQQFPTERRHHP